MGYDSSSSNLAYYQRGIRTNIAASDDVSVSPGNMVALSNSDDYYAIEGSQNNQVIRLYILTEIAPSITVSDIAPSFNSQDTSNIAYYETEMTINNQECTATTHNINLSWYVSTSVDMDYSIVYHDLAAGPDWITVDSSAETMTINPSSSVTSTKYDLGVYTNYTGGYSLK